MRGAETAGDGDPVNICSLSLSFSPSVTHYIISMTADLSFTVALALNLPSQELEMSINSP